MTLDGRELAANPLFCQPTGFVTECKVASNSTPASNPAVYGQELAINAGVKVAAGSDGNYGPDASTDLFSELETQVKYGMTPTQALASATVDAASCIGYEDQIGTLEQGKSADLVAMEGNPTEDISILRQIDFVMRQGCILASPIEDARAESCRSDEQ